MHNNDAFLRLKLEYKRYLQCLYVHFTRIITLSILEQFHFHKLEYLLQNYAFK